MNRRAAIKAMGSILAASLSAAGRSMRSPEDTPHADHGITRGTINVVMGNENGLVALTDSMLTEVLPNGVPRQLPTPGQKLFQLDRTSVCTVAGFIAAPIPFPEVEHTISAILQRYKAQLAANADSYHPTIGEKLNQLNFILQNELSLLADIRNKPEESRQYELELTLAGYDPDGKAKIASSTLKIDPALHPEWLVSIEDSCQWEVGGRRLTIVVRGERQVADDILNHPEHRKLDPAISRYRLSKHSRQPLSLKAMRELCAALARETAAHYAGVGGANQIAVLQHGSVTELEQISFPSETLRTIALDIAADGIFEYQEVGPDPRRVSLYIHNDFREGTVLLDGSYFAANSFKRCLIVYRGGNTVFAPDQDVSTSVLAFGKNVNPLTQTASHLARDFNWARVTTEEERPANP